MRHLSYSLIFCLFLVGACNKQPGEFPPEPQIYYQSTKPNLIDLMGEQEAVNIIFSFTDGDGNIANDASEVEPAIFIRRTRDTLAEPFPFPMPYIPQNIRPENGGVEGRVVINLGKEYFSLDSLHAALGGDTLTFDIYIQDELGNRSNVITTDSVVVTF